MHDIPPNECTCGERIKAKVKNSSVLGNRIYKKRTCECGKEWASIEVRKDDYDLMKRAYKLLMDILKEIEI